MASMIKDNPIRKRTKGIDNHINVIDLFCGAGGLHIGFEENGCDIQLCIDNNPLVEKTHRRNFPHIPLISGDIAKISTDSIRKYFNGSVDIIIGGSPCQGFLPLATEYLPTLIGVTKLIQEMNLFLHMQE
jgi:DNA (cytosine-5)-methyltransferase 1